MIGSRAAAGRPAAASSGLGSSSARGRSPRGRRYTRGVAKTRTVFLCKECGNTQPRWAGRCPDCGAWDALEAFREPALADAPAPGSLDTETRLAAGTQAGAVPLEEVPLADVARNPSGVAELDRVLGGGFVPGSAILIGGDPGVGKSTLLLQSLAAAATPGRTALYVSSEESAAQVRLRAERLAGERRGGLLVLSETSLPRILEQARRHHPAIVAIDSIQMLFRPDLPAAPGSATQLRRCCLDLVALAKRTGCVVIVVGHVTKDGQLAGPKLLEHLVDVVLSFEGDRHHSHRVIRAVKNRFGSTAELGILEMGAAGLAEPAAGTLAIDQDAGARAGSVIFPAVAGTRGLLAEIQALAATAIPGSAKRKATGLDANRLAVVIAVLEKHGGLRLADRDVFAAATGGLRIAEPAADLAIALAVAGAHYGRAIGPRVAVFGELGLTGEIRPVPQAELRVTEAIRRGAARVLVPAAQRDLVAAGRPIEAIRSLGEAIEHLAAVPSESRDPSRQGRDGAVPAGAPG